VFRKGRAPRKGTPSEVEEEVVIRCLFVHEIAAYQRRQLNSDERRYGWTR
jgi:hypothetical protein